ncbi:MAG: VWA domain-containing protein [Pseudomonadota bacterium]
MSERKKSIEHRSSATEIAAFLKKAAAIAAPRPSGRRGRLIFALDATASREPTWDRACHIQGEMFAQTTALGGLDIQLCYYRGYREFNASAWLSDTKSLLTSMTGVYCLGGRTQIHKVLDHTLHETMENKVDALVFIGDCMEEDIDQLCDLAAKLGIHGVPVFLFHEGIEPGAERAFKHIARLSKGAYCRFDSSSAQQLKDLLGAVAVYAAGGRQALEDFSLGKGKIIRRLTYQIGEHTHDE